MTIREAQNAVDEWIKKVGVRYFDHLTNTAILTEEVGELASLMARIYGEQSFKNPEEEKRAPNEMAYEMADVLFVLICLANQTGVDLESVFVEKMEKKTIRDKDRHQKNKKLR